MKGKWHVTIILVLLVILTGIEAYRSYENRQMLVYTESLSEIAVTVDEKELTLFDIAFYVAYQEKEAYPPYFFTMASIRAIPSPCPSPFVVLKFFFFFPLAVFVKAK